MIGSVIAFAADSDSLTEESRAALAELAVILRGKPQKVEVRGHAGRFVQPSQFVMEDSWELAYRRSRNTVDYLVTALGIPAQRIRLSVAGPNEPLQITGGNQQDDNARVEVFMLDEIVTQLIGTPQQRENMLLRDEGQH